ncbi:MAG: zf-TFIIB domain-containing protein [Chitinophagaceae bacterium]|nr:zf-TFIIB domain-containing protein [Chitinophagaceae bacterium]
MKCPNCSETLLMAERNSIEIDYCPVCRGIWLDKGELDKMLEYAGEKHRSGKEEKNNGHQQYPKYDNDQYKHSPQYHSKHHMKKGFLGDLFDFD